LESINVLTLASNDRKSVTTAYTDNAKTFDTVSRCKLLKKLQAYGISGQLLNWIQSFLSCRTQQTRVGQTLSAVTSLGSGVMQERVISPLLFVLFINDITLLFENDDCACKLYADDLKLYSVLDTDANLVVLQDTLSDIYHSSQKWQLHISFKCNLMYIGK
jgi:hypothetical protein